MRERDQFMLVPDGVSGRTQPRRALCIAPQSLLSLAPRSMEHLHQGMYLGFNGLRPISSPAIHSLWHEDNLNVTRFDDGSSGNGTRVQESLFNLGELLVSAGRDVAYVGSKSLLAPPLASNPSWRYLLANGPFVANQAYLRSLNLMVS